MHSIIKKIYLINIKNLLFFSILLSFINLSLLIKIYFSDDLSTALFNHASSVDSNLPDHLNKIEINIDEPASSLETETNTYENKIKPKELTISSKENLNNLPWAWIGLFIIINLGFYVYFNYYPNGDEILDCSLFESISNISSSSSDISSSSNSTIISSKETIRQIISNAINTGSISQSSGQELANLSSEQIFDSVINQGKNIRNDSAFNLIKSLQESKNNLLSQFTEGSQEYLIEKVKYTHIKNAVFKAHLEGFSLNSLEFSSRVNEILNNTRGLQSFLNHHGFSGKDIY